MAGLGLFMVAINNGDGNCAGRNAGKLFTRTQHVGCGFQGEHRGVEPNRVKTLFHLFD